MERWEVGEGRWEVGGGRWEGFEADLREVPARARELEQVVIGHRDISLRNCLRVMGRRGMIG